MILWGLESHIILWVVVIVVVFTLTLILYSTGDSTI